MEFSGCCNTDMNKKELNITHRALRKYRYFYYEQSESLISDYDYDMLEKKYSEGCDRHGVNPKQRVDSFVGFNFRIPMNLFYNEDKTPMI